MEEALVARLGAASAVAAIAGARVAWFGLQRGWSGGRVLISPVSPGRDYTHSGPDGLDGPHIQIDALGDDAATALALARALCGEMEQARDVVVGSTTVRFHPARLSGQGFADEGEQEGGAALFRVSQDFTFFFEEF